MPAASTPTTRRSLVRALIAAPDARSALAIARSRRELCDEALVRELLDGVRVAVNADLAGAARSVRALAAAARVEGSLAGRAAALQASGVLEHLAGRPTRALSRLREAAQAYEQAGRLLEAGDVHRALIDVERERGEHAAALRARDRAVRSYRRAGGADARRRGSLALNVGMVHWHREQPRRALRAYREARRWFEASGAAVQAASAMHNAGNELANLDRRDAAREQYREARARFRDMGLESLAIRSDYALASLDVLEGELDSALAALESVRARKEAVGDLIGVAHVDLEIAECCLRSNRLEEASAAGQAALDRFRRMDRPVELSRALTVLAGVAIKHGRHGVAARLLRRAAQDARRRLGRAGAATVEAVLAKAQAESAGPAQARRALHVARGAAAALGREGLRSRQAWALSVAARAAERAGSSTTARREAASGLRVAGRAADPRSAIACLLVLARLDTARGDRAAAFRWLRRAESLVERLRLGISSEESRLAFSLDKTEVHEALVANRLSVGTRRAIRQALHYAERGKARSLAERMHAGRLGLGSPASPATRKLLARLQQLDRDLAAAESRLSLDARSPGTRAARTQRVSDATSARSRLLDALARADAGCAQGAGLAPAQPLAALDRLPPDVVVLEFARSDGWLHAFVAGAGGVEAFPHVVREGDLAADVDFLRFHLGRGVLGDRAPMAFRKAASIALRRRLERLHAALIDPVLDRIDGRTVCIVPHGSLHGLPFHAFERGGRALVDACVVAQAPSLAVLGLAAAPGPGPAAGGSPLVLGVADDAAPEIELEVEHLRNALPTARVFEGLEATADVVRLSETRPPLLHVASHGYFSEGGARTAGLRLGNAWLSLPELYALRGTAELVVLSGCQTGRGGVHSGDEWVGLVRGFLQAGARSVVASLWEVHDASTVELMNDFYRELTAGHPVAAALALAQRRARDRDDDPLRWAPFIAMGHPHVTLPAMVRAA